MATKPLKKIQSPEGTIYDIYDSWRKVQLEGVDKLSADTSSNPLNFKAGTNMSITESNGTFIFNSTSVADGDKKTSSSNSTSKLFLVGATSQSTSGQTTYSNSSVYTTNGTLNASKFEAGSADIQSLSSQDITAQEVVCSYLEIGGSTITELMAEAYFLPLDGGTLTGDGGTIGLYPHVSDGIVNEPSIEITSDFGDYANISPASINLQYGDNQIVCISAEEAYMDIRASDDCYVELYPDRITASGATLTFPSKSGTLALTDDLSSCLSHITDTNNPHNVTAQQIGAVKTQSANDMLHNGNEFTFVPSGYSGQVYINHRTLGGVDGNITNYYFGNGKGGLATFIANYFKGKFQGDTPRPIYNNEEAAMMSDVNALEARLAALENSVVAVLSGTAEPTSDVGEDGDIYLVTEE